MFVMVVVHYLDIFKRESINLLYDRIELDFRKLERLSLNLETSLISMIEVKVTIAACPNEFTGREIAYLCHHACKESV